MASPSRGPVIDGLRGRPLDAEVPHGRPAACLVGPALDHGDIASASHQGSSGDRRGLIGAVSAAWRSLQQALRRSRHLVKGLIMAGKLSRGVAE
jgi:hypothetical protein